MINGLSFDVEDWFQVENLRSAFPLEKWGNQELRVEKNTDLLLDILEKFNQKATFFVLGWIAQKKPGMVKRIASEGHEIASHGYGHEIIYNLTEESFRKDLALSKKILEDITGSKVIGYRAPNFSITRNSSWAINILHDFDFKYDSSIFPTSFHDRYGYDGVNGSNFFKFGNGLQEFPLTIYRFAKLNFPIAGGAYFRFIPYVIMKNMLKKINLSGKEFVFYLHPWELDIKQPKVKVQRKYYIRHYTNLRRTESKLKRLLQDFSFQPLKEFLRCE